jgi:hypothetical protein
MYWYLMLVGECFQSTNVIYMLVGYKYRIY